MKLLPFVNKPLEEIEMVGTDRTGQLFLVSINGITPNENPKDFQEQQKNQQKFLLRLNQRIKTLATEYDVPVKEMRKRVMGAMTPESNPLNDYQIFVSSIVNVEEPNFAKKSNIIYLLRSQDTWALRIVPENPQNWKTYYLNANESQSWAALQSYLINSFGVSEQWPVTENLSSDQISKLKYLIGALQLTEFSSEEDDQIFDYLDEQTAELLFNLQEDKARLAIRAATFMVKHRTVYPVVSKSNAVPGSKTIYVDNPNITIERNTSIRFGPDKYVETSEILAPRKADCVALHIDESTFKIKDGDLGFICSSGTRNLKIGYPEWTEEDTRTLLPEELISLLFNFYQKEAGIISDDEDLSEGGDTEGNLLTLSQSQLELNPSTGEESSIDSNTSELPTQDLTMKDLEVNLVG